MTDNSKQYWTAYVRYLIESEDEEGIVDTLLEMEALIKQLQETK